MIAFVSNRDLCMLYVIHYFSGWYWYQISAYSGFKLNSIHRGILLHLFYFKLTVYVFLMGSYQVKLVEIIYYIRWHIE
jgi:hypothetical protein